jgi:hypothetical protein
MDETRERGAVPIVCLRKVRPIPLTAIPYGSDEWKRLYRGRAAVEREFGRLKNEYALAPLRVRGWRRSRFTPTSASSPGSPALSPEREPYHSPLRFPPARAGNQARMPSTVAIVAIAVVVVVALIALMYILPRGGRRPPLGKRNRDLR